MPVSDELARKIANALQDEAASTKTALARVKEQVEQRLAPFKTKYFQDWLDAQWQVAWVSNSERFINGYEMVLEGLLWLACGAKNRGIGTFEEGLSQSRGCGSNPNNNNKWFNATWDALFDDLGRLSHGRKAKPGLCVGNQPESLVINQLDTTCRTKQLAMGSTASWCENVNWTKGLVSIWARVAYDVEEELAEREN